jgi:chemosensory pili system protein ChpA (sensor histidine kinase/response regulator)
MAINPSSGAGGTQADLSPLAWVLEELQKSLDQSNKALRRFLRERDEASSSGEPAREPVGLRAARAQVHQGVGALDMVGEDIAATHLRTIEAGIGVLTAKPAKLSEATVTDIERACFALVDYLGAKLAGREVSSVGLFPQYQAVAVLAGAERIHPADLWPHRLRWAPVPVTAARSDAEPAQLRQGFERGLLDLMRGNAPAGAATMLETAQQIAARVGVREAQSFWGIASAWAEALAQGLLAPDLHVKRTASRLSMQVGAWSRGDDSVSERLATDLLFFCAAAGAGNAKTPALAAVWQSHGLRVEHLLYQAPVFGLVDPAIVQQARKRLVLAKDSWTAVTGGDMSKVRSVVDQFALVAESIERLYPDDRALGVTLNRVAAATAQSAEPPKPELGLEVATALLFVEASFEDVDPANPQAAVRAARLAQRVEDVRTGGQSAPLEPWMEDLYRGVSDRQTMGTVVAESRTLLGEVEKQLDAFFRNPMDSTVLREVPSRLLQLRGVLSLLGLEVAAQAASRMRDAVDEILVTQVDPERAKAAGTFDKLADNLGALGLLIDMLSYQPGLAKQLFVFDADTGVLQPVMGRSATDSPVSPDVELVSPPEAGSLGPGSELGALVALAQHDALAPADLAASLGQLSERAAISDDLATAAIARELAQTAAQGADSQTLVTQAAEKVAERAAAMAAPPLPSPEPEPDVVEDDLRDIFLEEAAEVLGNGRAALATLLETPTDADALTIVRRAFHTLKGSSRMVGLNEFGEAAWAMEQVFNAWLAGAHPAASADLLGLAGDAFDAFAPWIDAVRSGSDASFRAKPFQDAGLAFREDGRRLPLLQPSAAPEVPEPVALPDWATDAEAVLELPELAPPEPVAPASPTDLPPVPADQAASEAGIAFESFATEPMPLADDEVDTPPPEPVVLAGGDDFVFDLSDLAPAVEAKAVPPAEPALLDASFLDELEPSVASPSADAPPSASSLQAMPQPEPVQPPSEPVPVPEDVRVVGHLRIGIALYNVYLNEADEKSRRLSTDLAEWAAASGPPVSETAVMDAHSLAGSSATVGFEALAELAHKLELALLRNRERGRTEAVEIPAFTGAADDIRRLLHQFAAGFLKPASESVWAGLNALDELPDLSAELAAEVTEDLDGPPTLSDPVYPDEPVAARQEQPHPAEPDEALASAPLPVAPVSVAAQEPLPAAPARQGAPGLSLLQADDEDEDIDAVDTPDPDLFPIFDEEAHELMPALSGQLRALQAQPADQAALSAALRSLHTLKGSARLAGAMRIGELAHRMESDIEAATQAGGVLGAAQLAPLQARFDRIESALEGLRQRDAADYSEALQAAAPAAPVTDALPASIAADAALADALSAGDGEAKPPVPRSAAAVSPPTVPQARGTLTGQSVRVRAQLLDRLVNQAGEVSIARSRLETELSQLKASLGDMTDNLERMRQHLRDIELQGETQMQSRIAAAKEAEETFDPLEMDRFTRFQELTRMMAESVNDVATVQRTLQRTLDNTEDDLAAQARLTRELQRDLLRTRMVEFDSISERLYRLVRLAGKETGKQVRLDVQGGNIDIDRGVLERMAPAFEHLLRNCVAHGIELPETREALGKDPVGTITVSLQQAGNDVSVSFADDGGGIDTDKVFARAVRQGLAREAERPSEAELMQMIFMPGFSTAAEVSELAGRGIGMDVVRNEINALGGRIETRSERGQGTRFELVLPLTTAVTQVVMLRVGDLTVGVPANLVEIVRRASPDEVQAAYASGQMTFAGETVPFHWLGALLQGASRGGDLSQRTLPVVVLRSAAQRVAAHVDEVLGNQEVVVKNLGPQLSRLPGLAGMSVLASGAIVLIYNPVALATVYGEQARAQLLAPPAELDGGSPHGAGLAGGEMAPTVATPATQVPLVLVVDDSITVRRVTQRLLQREGYRVELAKDGLDALEKLQGERPCVVLSDIEMPRMDGFDLARTIRGDKALRSLPIVMITSRLADKHREYAREIGTDHYLGKPYSEEELLSLVKRYAANPYSEVAAALTTA